MGNIDDEAKAKIAAQRTKEELAKLGDLLKRFNSKK
jgi:hypothetical protein